jgi:hypothetical protein
MLLPIGIALGLALIAGCGHLYTDKQAPVHRNWGAAFHASRLTQVLDPTAGQKLEPLTGMDGQACTLALEAYHATFTKETREKSPVTININGLQ